MAPEQSYYIVALPGDGIGPEVLAAALRVLRAAGELFQIDFRIEEIECGGHYYAEYEVEWPAGSFEKCEAADAIVLGAVGHEVDGKTVFTKPGKPYPEPQLAGFAQVIGNRQKLDLYANVRPVKLYEGVRHKIHGELKQVWEPGKVDYVVIRENTEDAYTGETNPIDGGQVTPIKITRRATERVVRYAFNLVRRRHRHALCAPSHGSAPKHAGKDTANPLPAILSAQMMVDWLGNRHEDERLLPAAEKVEDAVAELLREGQTLTYDLIGDEKASRCSE